MTIVYVSDLRFIFSNIPGYNNVLRVISLSGAFMNQRENGLSFPHFVENRKIYLRFRFSFTLLNVSFLQSHLICVLLTESKLLFLELQQRLSIFISSPPLCWYLAAFTRRGRFAKLFTIPFYLIRRFYIKMWEALTN